MAPKHLPPESLPRRVPTGGFHPITIHVRVNRDGTYLPRHLPVTGGPFRDFADLEDAVRARYASIYLNWHRRRKPHDPPPASTDRIFQFEFVVADGKQASPPAAQRPQEPAADVSSLKQSLSATTLEEKSPAVPSGQQPDQDTVMASAPSPPGSGIWERLRRDWGMLYYIRVDHGGSFHTYPYAGGPFQSLEEADKAMDGYFLQHRDPKLLMHQGGVSSLEMAIEAALYWPDGARKRSKSDHAERACNGRRRLLQALVDKHNEDHSLLGDFAYELKDVVECKVFSEKRGWYYHLNFTLTKGADRGIEDLFFVEVKYVRPVKQEELSVSCFCMIKPTDNGHCYGCTNNGSVNMKHPNSADEYTGGHLDVGMPFGCYSDWSYWDYNDLEAKKKELRAAFTGVDDPEVKEVSTVPPNAFLPEGSRE
ncbi:hypothetical protein ACQJBY_040266 [Aegilops geniculata]